MADATVPPKIKMVLPGWAKVLIGFFVATLIGICISIAMAAITFANFQKDCRDPEKIRIIAKESFRIEQLPPKFAWVAGYKLPPALTMVAASYDNDQTNVVFQQIENTHGLKEGSLPKILQNDPFQPGIVLQKPTPGEDSIAGHKMPYIVGDIGSSGSIKQFRGAYLTNDGKILNRVSGTSAASSFNMEALKQLLSCIK